MSIFGAVYFRLLLSFSFRLGWYHLWSRYVQMLRCALLREKELVVEPIAQTRWCNRAAVHLFLFIVSVIVLCVSSGGWSHHSECRHSLPDSADGATARREVSFANGFAQVADVELPPLHAITAAG